MKEFKKMTEPMTTPGEEEIDAHAFKENLDFTRVNLNNRGIAIE